MYIIYFYYSFQFSFSKPIGFTILYMIKKLDFPFSATSKLSLHNAQQVFSRILYHILGNCQYIIAKYWHNKKERIALPFPYVYSQNLTFGSNIFYSFLSFIHSNNSDALAGSHEVRNRLKLLTPSSSIAHTTRSK